MKVFTQKKEYCNILLQYIFILKALSNGWHVKILNNKTYSFSKHNSEISDTRLKRSTFFVDYFL
jgi:hypothetical protein